MRRSSYEYLCMGELKTIRESVPYPLPPQRPLRMQPVSFRTIDTVFVLKRKIEFSLTHPGKLGHCQVKEFSLVGLKEV